MKARKVLATVLCGAMLVAGSVGATLAYLTSETEVVNNTFTVGNVAITLDEADVNTDGTPIEGADRVTENEYHLLPNHSYTKDPTVHVDANSEDSWLFVKVIDEIAAIQDDTTVAAQMTANGWIEVAGVQNVYAYKDVVKANDNVVVFKSFKIKGDVDNATLAMYAGDTIRVQAYAVQKDGFDTAEAAWKEAPCAAWTGVAFPEEAP